MVPLDLKGNITLLLSVISLSMLVFGLPAVGKEKSEKKLITHGFLTIIALGIQIALFSGVMLPSFVVNIGNILALSSTYSLDAWLHFSLGSFAILSGFTYVGLWLVFRKPKMRCARLKKYMMITLYIWIGAIITGALIHILQIF